MWNHQCTISYLGLYNTIFFCCKIYSELYRSPSKFWEMHTPVWPKSFSRYKTFWNWWQRSLKPLPTSSSISLSAPWPPNNHCLISTVFPDQELHLLGIIKYTFSCKVSLPGCFCYSSILLVLPWRLRGWRICLQCGRLEFDPWVRKGMSAHSSILVWTVPWKEEPGGLQSMGSQRVGHDWATNAFNAVLLLVSVVFLAQSYTFIWIYSLSFVLADTWSFSSFWQHLALELKGQRVSVCFVLYLEVPGIFESCVTVLYFH